MSIRIDEIHVKFTVTLATETSTWDANHGPIRFQRRAHYAGDGASTFASTVLFRTRTVRSWTRTDQRTEQLVTEHMHATRKTGVPLDPEMMKHAEALTGAGPGSLSEVRVHSAPEEARKHRFEGASIGHRILLGPGLLSSSSPEARAVLFHELIHFVQWKRGLTRLLGRSRAGREMLESEALQAEHRYLDQLSHGGPQAPVETGAATMPAPAVARPMSPTGDHDDGEAQAAPANAAGLLAAQKVGPLLFRRLPVAQNLEAPLPDGSEPPEGARPAFKHENYIQQLMRQYAVRSEVGEEEFLDDIADRVKAVMDEELLLDKERRVSGAPFQYTPY